MLILFVAGIGLLHMNKLKFGSYTTTHGTYEKSAVQYGQSFWGFEAEDSPKGLAHKDEGKFHPKRLPPNILYVLAEPPLGLMPQKYKSYVRWKYLQIMVPIVGFIEYTNGTGLLFLWPLWLFMALCLFKRRKPLSPMAWVLIVSCLIPAVMTLAYTKVSIRYRLDLWPLIYTMVLLALPMFFDSLQRWTNKKFLVLASFAMLAMSFLATGTTIYHYMGHYQEDPASIFHPWERQYCQERLAVIGKPELIETELCRERSNAVD